MANKNSSKVLFNLTFSNEELSKYVTAIYYPEGLSNWSMFNAVVVFNPSIPAEVADTVPSQTAVKIEKLERDGTPTSTMEVRIHNIKKCEVLDIDDTVDNKHVAYSIEGQVVNMY